MRAAPAVEAGPSGCFHLRFRPEILFQVFGLQPRGIAVTRGMVGALLTPCAAAVSARSWRARHDSWLGSVEEEPELAKGGFRVPWPPLRDK